jgi:teichuronic acid biosynthesis glycosyltransferase TuaC
MKVLVFTSLYPNNIWPNHGVFIKERMTNFARLDGCEVKVIAPVPYFPPMKFNWRWRFSQVGSVELRDGIEVYHPRYVMTPKVGMSLYGLMMFLSVLTTVKRIERNFDFDLIDAHWVYPEGLAAVLLGHFFRKPVVVSARGSDINLYRTFPVIRRLLRYVLRNADRVVAVSQALKEAMIQLGAPEEKICHIPNGVDTSKFYPLPRERCRRELGLPNRRTILSVGNLTPNKGFDLLIKAFKIIADELSADQLQLIIVGEGSSRRELEKTISTLQLDGHVHLTGAVDHNQVSRWYGAADVFCLTSKREGWPNVVLESLACGRPVVATYAGGIPEIIQSDREGLLAERDDIKIAAALRAALNKTWPEEALAAYARNFGWEHTAASVHRVFQSVLAAKTRTALDPVIQLRR